jgi:hypothetical protein
MACGGVGPANKNSRPPPPCICEIPDPPTRLPALIFNFLIFLARFWAFLGKGSSKTPMMQMLLQKVHVENFPPKNDKNFDAVFP